MAQLLDPLQLRFFLRVLEPAASASPRNLLKMQVLRPHPDLLICKVWSWGPAIWDPAPLQGIPWRANVQPPRERIFLSPFPFYEVETKGSRSRAIARGHTHLNLALSLASRAAIVNSHKMVDNNNRNLSSHGSRGQKPQIKVPAGSRFL